jgi:MOSC domain-containing protein YiiM
MIFVNATERRALHLRGINAKVVQRGTIRVGDRVTKLKNQNQNQNRNENPEPRTLNPEP